MTISVVLTALLRTYRVSVFTERVGGAAGQRSLKDINKTFIIIMANSSVAFLILRVVIKRGCSDEPLLISETMIILTVYSDTE